MFEEMTERLRSQSVLISGGTSGIGLATARMLRQAGAAVGVVSNDARQIGALRQEFDCHLADVRVSTQVQNAVDAFVKQTGRIDALVNCAGVSLWRGLQEMDETFWDLIYDVNVKGTFLMCQAAAQHMVAQGRGAIVNVASMSGLKSGMPLASAYASSKWAVVGFSRNIHLELRPHGVSVGCLCPGSTLTDIHRSAGSEQQDAMIDPQDIARALCFMLATPRNGHVQLLAMPAMFEEWK